MKFVKRAYLLLAISLTMPAIAAAGTVYDVNRTIGPGTVIGTIETSGVTGVLTSADIISWNLTTDDGSNGPSALNTANSTVSIGGDLLSASPTEIQFNFADSTGFLLIQSIVGRSLGLDFWSLNGSVAITVFGQKVEVVHSGTTPNTGVLAANVARQGSVVIATSAVPVPASFWLLAPALCGIGLARRRTA